MQSVLFDPGYSKCILGVSDNTSFMYNAFLLSNMPLKQKKFQFSIMFPKIKKMTEQNVSFYLGCLLWAVYLKNHIADGIFEHNPYYGMKFDENIAYDETNFLIDFIGEKLDKDAKFYINAHYDKDERFINILKTYNDFLKLNKGFVEVKTVEDVVIPNNIKSMGKDDLKIIKEKIDESVKFKNLPKLLDVYNLIFER